MAPAPAWLACAMLACTACEALYGVSSQPLAHDAAGPPDAPACVRPNAVYIAPGDYDGDGFSNACDPCPGDPTVWPGHNDTDSDGDGIPDACDPDVAGVAAIPDCLVLFDYFDDDHRTQPIDARWTGSPAWQWTTTVDGLALYSPSGVGSNFLYFDAAMPVITQLEMRFSVESAHAFASAAITADSDAVTEDGNTCEWYVDSSAGSGALQGISIFTGPQQLNNDPFHTPFAIPGQVALRWRPGGITATCDETAPVSESTSAITQSPVGTRVGIVVTDLQAGLRSVEAFSACTAAP